jgi:hypothetical protein
MTLKLLLVIITLIGIKCNSNEARAMHSGHSEGDSMTETGATNRIDVELRSVKTTPGHWEF